MTRAELILVLASRFPHLPVSEIERSAKCVFEMLTTALAAGERIEIRGFGSFSVRHRLQRAARNPKTGEMVVIPEKWVPHFRAGKELRERVNRAHPDLENVD